MTNGICNWVQIRNRFGINKYDTDPQINLFVVSDLLADCRLYMIRIYRRIVDGEVEGIYIERIIEAAKSGMQRSEEEYEQQIRVLQEKLEETHDKLMDQLDQCMIHERTVLKYESEITQFQKRKSRGLYDSHGLKEREELLKRDLQAMRKRLMDEMGEKKNIKERITNLQTEHRMAKQTWQSERDALVKRIRQIEVTIEKRTKESDNFKQQISLISQRYQTALETNRSLEKTLKNEKVLHSSYKIEEKNSLESTKELVRKMQQSEFRMRRNLRDSDY